MNTNGNSSKMPFQVDVAPQPDKSGKRLVIISRDGRSVRDKIDVNQNWLLEKLCQRAAEELCGPYEHWTAERGTDYSRVVAELSSEVLRQGDQQDKAATDENHIGRPILLRLNTVEPESIQWLWPGRVAIGKLTLLAGDPGLGKSLVTLDMAARVSQGAAWPDTDEPTAPGGVVLLSAEDDPADTIRPRLDAAGWW
jgi:hypothetical protein